MEMNNSYQERLCFNISRWSKRIEVCKDRERHEKQEDVDVAECTQLNTNDLVSDGIVDATKEEGVNVPTSLKNCPSR